MLIPAGSLYHDKSKTLTDMSRLHFTRSFVDELFASVIDEKVLIF
jgi:hypothetical protein